MRKIITIGLLTVSLLISGCATVKGLGRDIESIGQAGSDAIH